jgi:phosphate:Na+ symporter
LLLLPRKGETKQKKAALVNGSLILLNLAGAVALLLWATRMVRSGVEAVFGAWLRTNAGAYLKNPLVAALTGVGLAVLFQSATAASLLISGFAAQQVISVTSGIIALLGADLGSAVAVRLLSFNLKALSPVLILIGTVTFMASNNFTARHAGRIIIGIGLLLLALTLIGTASEPLRESSLLPVIVNRLASDSALAFVLAAIVTWLMHSSIASILLIATLASQSIVPPELGIDLMLGANFGGAMIAAALTRSGRPDQRAVTLGNLMLRGLGAIVVAVALSQFAIPLGKLAANPALQIVHGHILFNAALLVIGMILAPLAGRLARKWAGRNDLEAKASIADSEAETALDEAALPYPKQAIANATREVLRLTETIDVMLARIIDLYRSSTVGDLQQISQLDDRVDRRHAAIKLYLARATAKDVTEAEAMHCQELVAACVKLEQVGDIIVRNMLTHVQKMRDRKITFTPEGAKELSDMHRQVLANARLAFNVIVNRDTAIARSLVEEKDKMREIERIASQNHFERLREGTPTSIESSSIHLDTIRDLKEINALLASLAYPVLEQHGQLRGSRLKKG